MLQELQSFEKLCGALAFLLEDTTGEGLRRVHEQDCIPRNFSPEIGVDVLCVNFGVRLRYSTADNYLEYDIWGCCGKIVARLGKSSGHEEDMSSSFWGRLRGHLGEI